MSLSNNRSTHLKWILLSIALFSYALIVNSQTEAYASADAGFALTTSQGNACPDSGVWPPGCVPGGTADTTSNTGGSNACPTSGPWPPGCVPGGSGGNADTGNTSGNACPTSGPWPPGCVPGGSGGNVDTGNTGGNACPQSGPWPQGCVPGGTDGGQTTPAPEVETAPAPAPAPVPTVSDARLNALIDQTILDLNAYWQVELRNQNVNYRKPSRVYRYEGDPNTPPNAFFVPRNDFIAIDMRLMREIANEFGEYSAMSVLAHEWGHLIQDRLNLFDRDVYNINFELQADCMTGAFVKVLHDRGSMNDNDVRRAGDLFFSIGDDQLSGVEIPQTHPGAHGSGDQRRVAYNNGYNSDAHKCIHSYQ